MDSAAVHFHADTAEIVCAPELAQWSQAIAADLFAIGSKHADISRAAMIVPDRSGARAVFAFTGLTAAVDLEVRTGAVDGSDGAFKVAGEAWDKGLIADRALVRIPKDARHAASPPLPS
ncbi:hypothetical protein [Rhizobium flavescens]|uniref:hypothetical protein n=1 Tax=Rhizobium flavescens TaxID=2607407 RepID=UPI00140CEEFE|nr:hypothetical protein [Rhizobium flavescens]